MLDDLKYIARFDTQDALGVAQSQWKQLEFSFALPPQEYQVENIVFVGMGGSALAAQLSCSWPGYPVPFEIVRGYSLPQYVGSQTLLIVSSYSGNTEEVLAALDSARSLECHVITMSAGGALAEMAQEQGYEHCLLPSGLQPRYAVLYGLKAIVTILESLGFLKASEAEQQLHTAAAHLRKALVDWGAEVPTAKNQAKQIAEHLAGKTPIIYAGSKLFPAAYKWKISFNENAKNTAWCGEYSEFNHNEFVGWTSHPIEKPFGVVDLISNFEHPQILKRFTLTDRLLSGKRPKALEVQAQGETLLEQLLWTVALGDMVSIYLALLNGLNPTPVDLLEKFKKELAS